MRLPSPEALVISSVINTGDLGAVTCRGLTGDHFAGYRSEWEFLLNYRKTYDGQLPTEDVLSSVFPDFPFRASTGEPGFYADQVLHRHDNRLVRAALLESGEHVRSGDLSAALSAVSRVRLSAKTSAAVDAIRTTMVLDEIGAERQHCVPYPWPSLHHLTGGMWPGDYAVYAARSTVGKTWALIYTAANAVLGGNHVVYYSLEMPVAQIVARVHVVIGQRLGIVLSHKSLHERTVDRLTYKKLLERMDAEVPGQLDVIDTSTGRITPASVASRPECDLAIIDHLGLMSTGSGSRAIEDWRVMASISNELKEVAIATEIPVLSAAQVNREGARAKAMPGLTDLAQSDSIGQDADMVLSMRRVGEGSPVLKYGVPKNRHGDNNKIFYSEFFPDVGRMREIDEERAQDLLDG